MTGSVYCIDASSLIECNRRYPESNFPGVWERLRELSEGERLITSRQVLRELEQRPDEVTQWVKDNKAMVRPATPEELSKAKEIECTFPGLVDYDKQTEDADPFVIALALVEAARAQARGRTVEHLVVSEELPAKPGGRPKIPDVCAHYGLRCVKLLQLIQEEQWQFG